MRLLVIARRVTILLLWAAAAFALASAVLVAGLRWLDPPISSFMMQHGIGAWLDGHQRPWVHQQWVALDAMAPAVLLAVVAAEDQRFPHHGGFDLIELKNAWRDFRAGGRLRGASTLTQQVAKNLFLWPGKSLVRKALEAWFTLLLEAFLSKGRILEIYLNIAQTGPDTFGMEAAAWRFFHRPAVALTGEQASLLAAVLPNPRHYRAEAPSAHVRKKAAWIRKQMRQLGPDYLSEIAGPRGSR